METKLRGFGYLRYDPGNGRTRKDPYWSIVKCDYGIVAYYANWIKKDRDIELTSSAWGAHISVTRGERPKNKDVWRKYKGRKIRFEYSPTEIVGRFGYWWLPVISPDLEEIRVELGLRATPRKPFHITIGKEIDWNSLEQRKSKSVK